MSFRVNIVMEGVQETISRLNQIEEKTQQNLVNIAGQISDDGKTAWKEATPYGRSSAKRKTPHMRDDENATPSGLSVSFTSPTYYYDWVDKGHKTPEGWQRPWGYQVAKKRSFVKGREMTKKLVDWLSQNMTQYLSKFLDNV